jgi:hypothetical protein
MVKPAIQTIPHGIASQGCNMTHKVWLSDATPR